MSNEQTRLEVAIANMPESISPYHLAQVATAVVGHKVYGPYLHTLVKKGTIPAYTGPKGTRQISGADAAEWLEGYVNGTRSGRSSAMQDLLAQITAE